jgi:protein-L-isoaspartate(D-aspartate) O-methyltransferase
MGYYDEIAKGYNELHGEEQLKKLKVIAKHLKINKDTKLLDVGCGTGLSSKVFNCDMTGVDPSEKLLEQCPFKSIKASVESLPFEDNEFDVVIAVTSIHNFKDIRKALKEIRRVGKDQFVLTILKRSPKKNIFQNLVHSFFSVDFLIEEDMDLILVCS